MSEKTQQNQNEKSVADALKEAAEAAEKLDEAVEQAQTETGEKQAESKMTPAEAQAIAKAAENYDLYVRAMAEMENLRRRSAEDVLKAQKFGIEKFAQSLLPVVDSIEKAVEMTAGMEGPMRDGLIATQRQLLHALDVNGMKSVNPQGAAFDPASQQAIAMVPADDGKKPGSVAEVFQRGWTIHDRILRPAMVSVVQG